MNSLTKRDLEVLGIDEEYENAAQDAYYADLDAYYADRVKVVTCRQCGDEFETISDSQSYCPDCQRALDHAGAVLFFGSVKRTCLGCGEEFEATDVGEIACPACRAEEEDWAEEQQTQRELSHGF